MASAKRFAESATADDAVRPSKKSKTADSEHVADGTNGVKKAKKDKKKDKKPKSEEVETVVEDDAEAQRVAKELKKAAKKAAKKEKKLKEAAEADTEVVAAEAPADKKKSKKDKKANPAPSESSAVLQYSQTMSLSGVPQADIDAFMATHEIFVTDPRTEAVTLRPVTEFLHLPSTNLLEKKPSPFAGYTTPTPIQAASWPFTLSGRDAVGVAETGSGKTMAFALPCVESVLSIGKKGIKAVIVSPTRELAMQTHEQLSKLAALVHLKSICIYGGASKDDQRHQLSRGVDIVVATPGRLKDFMSDDTVDLSGARFVVLDEADRMLDKGFEDDIKLILGSCPPREQRQTLMFTATWPTSVQTIAATFMVDPVKIAIGSSARESAGGAVELQANARIVQRVEVLEPRDKEWRLQQILKEHQAGSKKDDRILVFCLYKKEATRVEETLRRKGFRVCGIHGDLRQEQRTKSLEAFKSGTTPVLVATDVAARGLDIPEVKLVINVTVCRVISTSLPKASKANFSVPPDH